MKSLRSKERNYGISHKFGFLKQTRIITVLQTSLRLKGRAAAYGPLTHQCLNSNNHWLKTSTFCKNIVSNQLYPIKVHRMSVNVWCLTVIIWCYEPFLCSRAWLFHKYISANKPLSSGSCKRGATKIILVWFHNLLYICNLLSCLSTQLKRLTEHHPWVVIPYFNARRCIHNGIIYWWKSDIKLLSSNRRRKKKASRVPWFSCFTI